MVSAIAASAGTDVGTETLRLIARLPTPEGLEDRVHATLGSTSRQGRVLSWPAPRADSNWMRTAAAAAAIVAVVAGGGWGVYSRVERGQPAKALVLPPRVTVSGGFSSAGAMRTPQTLNGPVVARPVSAAPAAKAKVLKKLKPRSAAAGARAEHAVASRKGGAQPAATAAK
jgi:hypothetical protein